MVFLILVQDLVKKAVSLAIARDGASGGVVRTVIVRTFLFLLAFQQLTFCYQIETFFEAHYIAEGIEL